MRVNKTSFPIPLARTPPCVNDLPSPLLFDIIFGCFHCWVQLQVSGVVGHNNDLGNGLSYTSSTRLPRSPMADALAIPWLTRGPRAQGKARIWPIPRSRTFIATLRVKMRTSYASIQRRTLNYSILQEKFIRLTHMYRSIGKIEDKKGGNENENMQSEKTMEWTQRSEEYEENIEIRVITTRNH